MLNKKDVRSAMKGMTNLRKELEKERSRLKGSHKTLRKHAAEGSSPVWAQEVYELYGNNDYSYIKLLRLMRKHKIL